MGSRALRKFTAFELLIITMMAALGIAVKSVVVPLAQMITGPLYIPGGVVAGGFYMLWIVLGYGLVNKAVHSNTNQYYSGTFSNSSRVFRQSRGC